MSANITLGIWKWIEAYVDIGSLKKEEKIFQHFWIWYCFNIIPDYLEIYFPILSSNGWEIDRNEYSKKIRFVLTMNTKQFLGLFSRDGFKIENLKFGLIFKLIKRLKIVFLYYNMNFKNQEETLFLTLRTTKKGT